MQCLFCGHPLTAEMRMCPFCGTKIMTTRGPVQKTPAAKTTAGPVKRVYRLLEADVAARPKRRRWLAWLLALLTLSLLALWLLWLLQPGI
jgi:hypothetical protein